MLPISGFLAQLRRHWKIRTDPIGFARAIGVKIDADCRLLNIDPATFGTEPYLITLGKHVTVTSGVKFITHDGGAWVFRKEDPNLDIVAPITVGDNVFIGINSVIMPGVTIGNNSVVGAGSIVTRDVDPETVVAGVPARRISSLDDYRKKAEKKGMSIKHLPPAEKRRYLVNRFMTNEN